MGLLQDHFLKKKPNAKFWVTLILDFIIIGILIVFSIYARNEYSNGYRQGYDDRKKECGLCVVTNSTPISPIVSNIK